MIKTSARFFVTKIRQSTRSALAFSHIPSISMDIPKNITIISCMRTFAWIGDTRISQNLRFDHTKIILQGSSGAYYHTRTKEGTMNPGEVILTGLKMYPIPFDHIYPKYHINLLRAPNSILSSCYIKRPALIDYEDGENAHNFKNYMMAEIETCEILRRSPHPNIAEYLGCLVVEDGLIHGICLTPYEVTLQDSIDKELSSIDTQACLIGIRKGLDHLHGLGLVHNDINPRNIMIHNGKAIIIDFDSCVKEGGDLLKGGTIDWSLTDMKQSDKQNDYYGLELIEKWLIKSSQKLETGHH